MFVIDKFLKSFKLVHIKLVHISSVYISRTERPSLVEGQLRFFLEQVQFATSKTKLDT